MQELCEQAGRVRAVWTGRSCRSCVNREVVQGSHAGAV